ncbi:MAG: transposase [[Ruminococcus] lactaris]|uniref:transposase n=1 Tax=[Ruminococcus] lactaris TaxID=46228 RepID=UPI0039A16F41
MNLVEKLDSALDSILNRIRQLITFNKNEKFIQQIKLLNTIPGVGFLTAVTIMCEIGDFSAFRNPKQLFAYFGLDPEVNESGKFVGTQLHMSKRGSRIARRAIFAVALASIRTKRNGEGINPYLRKYYELKSGQKPKMVAIGAVMHKVCNIVFAVLRDEKAFELRSPEEHCKQYQRPALAAA